MHRFLALLTFSAVVSSASAQDLSAPLPADPHVVRGQLPNGLHYIIRRNLKPEKRAELRLVVNAGSILEDDNQRGLAHFVEHMMFDGTKRFPKQDIVNFTERVGMRFGADLNAYTSFDETVYMLQVPTDTARLVNSALDILQDWAGGATTFDPAEIKKERGVVIEEWRTGRDASTRVQNRQFPVMLQGSRYALRVPIGTRENLEAFADSLAVKFYRDWYRPDLMTVVAVGDFDAAQMEASIRQRFAAIPGPKSPRAREYAAVPDHDETLVSIETDKEYPLASVGLLWLKPRDSVRTIADYRRSLVTSLYDGMVNARFSEIAQRADAPFAFAQGGHGGFVRTKDAYTLFAGVKESGFEKAAEALLAESERISRFGFTQTELDRQRTNSVRSLEQQFAERDKTNSSRFVDEFVSSALWGTPIVGIEQQEPLAKSLAPTITLAEVNALSKTSFGDKSRVVLVAAPEKPEIHVPSAAAMLKVFDAARSATLTAYVDSSSDAALVPSPPAPGRIVAERTLPETGITEWTLSNGARVLLKPTDFKADELLFASRSAGGESLVPDADVVNADLSSVVMSRSGAGSFNAIALGKKLAGKKVNVAAGIDGTGEGVRATASAQDIETMFQLAWLRMTAPRVDTGAYLAFKAQMRAMLANQKNDPESVFGDTVEATMAQHHPRVHLLSPELLDSVDLRRALDIYRDRFADASGFTFFLVGSFKPDSVRPLVERYLASLPSLNRHEKVRDNGIRPPAGVVEKTVRKGVEPKAETSLIFSGACSYSFATRYALDALTELLNIRLREVLREEKGGTYGASAGGSCNNIPYEHYSLSVEFGSAPERVDELVASVFKVFDEIKAGTVSDSNLTKIREIELRDHETGLKQNASWLNAMTDADEDHRDQRDFLRYPDLVKALTRETIRDAAKLYLRPEQYARFTLLPEAAPKPPAIKPD
ncbi:MAG: M16 family metallopeptidase [Gemmatimonadales bacterium]